MLVRDWKRVAKRAWSVRFAVAAAVFSTVEMALPIFYTDLPRGLFMGLAFIATLGGLISRFVAQPGMHDGD
jgi:hypothetical protein